MPGQVWKISKKEFDRIKELNKNGFFNRRCFPFRGKYYEHQTGMSLGEIARWQTEQRRIAEEQQAKAEQQAELDLYQKRDEL